MRPGQRTVGYEHALYMSVATQRGVEGREAPASDASIEELEAEAPPKADLYAGRWENERNKRLAWAIDSYLGRVSGRMP